MKRFLVLGLIVSVLPVPALGEEEGIEPALGDYVSVVALDSILAAATIDRVIFFQVDSEREEPISPIHQLIFDETRGSIQFLLRDENVLYVVHRTSVSVVELGMEQPPQIIAEITLRGPVKGLGRIGSHLFAACLPSELVVVDIADPTAPKTRIRVPTGNRPTGLVATGERILIRSSSGATQFFDVSSPRLPRPVTTVENLDPLVSPAPGLVYAWSRRTTPAKAVAFAVDNADRSSDLPIPGEQPLITMCVCGTSVYAADRTGKIFAVESAGAPRLLGCLDAEAEVTSLASSGGFLFAVDRKEGDLVVLDSRDLEPCPEPPRGERRAGMLPALAWQPESIGFPPIDARGSLPVQIPSLAPPNLPQEPVQRRRMVSETQPQTPERSETRSKSGQGAGYRTITNMHGDDSGLYPAPRRIMMDPQGRVFVDYRSGSANQGAQSPLKKVLDLPFKGFGGTKIRDGGNGD